MNEKRLYRWIVYFRRGHQSYFAMFFSFLNFIVIQYKLLIENVFWLRNIFTSLTVFAIIFVAIYVPIAILVGWYDTWRMTKPREFETNPYFFLPTAKERDVYVPFYIALIDALIMVLEEKGFDTSELREAKKRLIEWSRKCV